MANGIEDLMNIRTTGGTQNVPPRPPMQGGLASMGAGQPTMPPVVDDQMSMPPMGGQEMPSEQPQEQGMSIEQDAAMLAEATIGRTGGDSQAAVAILDTAKAMLMQGGQEEPMMMMGGGPLYREDGGPMYANMGRPLYREDGGKLNPGLQALQKTNPEVVDKILKREMGGPLYAEDGMPLTDAETMKQMIMNSLATTAATANSQTGRAISDKDINFQKEMMSDMNYQDALDMLVKQRRSSTN